VRDAVWVVYGILPRRFRHGADWPPLLRASITQWRRCRSVSWVWGITGAIPPVRHLPGPSDYFGTYPNPTPVHP
jgi:hypothetical protein